MQFLPVLPRGWKPGSTVIALVLTACGGGGADDQSPASATSIPFAAPAQELTPPAILPVPEPVPVPVPVPVTVPPRDPAAPTPQVQQQPPAGDAAGSQALAAASTCSLPGFAADMLSRINAARAAGRSCGGEMHAVTAPLTWNEQLFSAAGGHSADMAGRNYFAHATPEGVDPAQRAAAAGYSWSAAGENIAAGDVSVNGVMATWLQSDGHCRNIMNPAFTEVAVACVKGNGSSYGTYWTMLLGRR